MSDTPRVPVRVGIFGASGTTGATLCALIAGHPRCVVAFATSREYAGRSLRAVEPGAPDVALRDPGEVRTDDVDVVFTCLPHGAAAEIAGRCAADATTVIDLSGDLRLPDAKTHAAVYGTPRDETLVTRSVYGMTELTRGRVCEATLVSNPGCYPTCSTLALAPLAQQGLLGSTVVINALSGVSGAGRSPTATTHFCSVYGDAVPYKLGREHRHTAEIEQMLAALRPADVLAPQVVFCPHVIPIARGMLATITIPLATLTAAEVHELFVEAYRDEAFVDVLPLCTPARIGAVVGTNEVVIGLHPSSGRERHVIVTCAIDNLLKGAAGQAVQNMNLMLGLPETAGLPTRARVA